MGAAAKHSSGEFPLVLSTELARETDSKGKIKLLGHINARSNGSTIVKHNASGDRVSHEREATLHYCPSGT
jgi:hypothetical protein